MLDAVPHPAAMNMAIDQAILESALTAVLRVFHWDVPSISIGYSHDFRALEPSLPAWPAVRRWTGGGVVWHDNDSTYSLIVPASDPWSQTRPVESYRQIHRSLAAILNDAGHGPCHLTGEEDRKEGSLCFEAPALYDITRQGIKIAGAGQRRTRHGLLHQGSLKQILDDASWIRWAQSLAEQVHVEHGLPDDIMARATSLVCTRYGTEDWLLRR